MDYQAVIPEFVVSDIEKSRHFYCDLLGFSVEYDRPEEISLLSLEDCQLMLEEGSAEEVAQLTPYPFGRGVNISFGIADVPQLHQQLLGNKLSYLSPITKESFVLGSLYLSMNFAVWIQIRLFLRFSW